mgnify:CR=1 FL=1
MNLRRISWGGEKCNTRRIFDTHRHQDSPYHDRTLFHIQRWSDVFFLLQPHPLGHPLQHEEYLDLQCNKVLHLHHRIPRYPRSPTLFDVLHPQQQTHNHLLHLVCKHWVNTHIDLEKTSFYLTPNPLIYYDKD